VLLARPRSEDAPRAPSALGPQAVFGYTDVITDYQAFLVEALYYHLTDGTKARIAFDEIAEILRFTVDYLRIDDDPDALTAPLLVAETLD
jgi:hypothetical protein